MRVVLFDPLSNRSAVLFDDRYESESNTLYYSDNNTVLTVTSPRFTVASLAYGQPALGVRVDFQVRLQEDVDDAGRPLPEEYLVWKADTSTFAMMWDDADGDGPRKGDLA
eukprot:9673-Eustigmatos_ZCMA.PRE.1